MATVSVERFGDSAITTVTVAAGETTNPVMIWCQEAIVALMPGGGGSMLAQASWSAISAIQAGGGNWQDWDAGTVTAPKTQALSAATAVRFTATGQPGVAEIRQ